MSDTKSGKTIAERQRDRRARIREGGGCMLTIDLDGKSTAKLDLIRGERSRSATALAMVEAAIKRAKP